MRSADRSTWSPSPAGVRSSSSVSRSSDHRCRPVEMLPTVARIKRRPKGSIDGSDRLTAHRLSAVPILLIGAFLGLALATYWQMYRRNGGREDNRPTAEVEPMKPAGSGQEVAIRNRLIAL